MIISEVIRKLEEYKKIHGDITVRVSKDDDYWGSLYYEVDDFTLTYHKSTQRNPKKHENTPAIVFCSYY